MYLTQEEFNVLSGKKIGLSNFEISQKFKMSETEIKIAYKHLLAKYDVNDSLQLIEKANIKKVEVTEKPPYFEYEEIDGHKRLVKKLKIQKKYITALAKHLKNVEDEEFELIFDNNSNNFYKALYLKNQKTNELVEISSEITD